MKNVLRLGAAMAAFVLLMVALFLGFERLVSDIATRIRYALRDGELLMLATGRDSHVVTLAPNGWPDGCGERRFRVVLSPYKGNKQVPAADIDVHCANRHHYWTGTLLIVPRQMSVEKEAGGGIALTLTRTPAGITITDLR